MTITIDVSALITWIIIGAIAGWLASVVLRGWGMRPLWNIIIGLIGAVVGGLIFQTFKLQVPRILSGAIELRLSDIVVAFVGALIVLLVVGAIYRRRV
jgi:uncharacterized membrane protein YeaQ/YmgE (transglycosylase-associated protein family)